MAQFLVRVLTQCGIPSMTPDVENGVAELPKRMLYEHPPFMGPLLTRAGVVEIAAGKGADLDALAAARAVLPSGFALDVVPQPYAHREVSGTYVTSAASGERVFIVGTPSGSDVAPLTTNQTHNFRVASAAGITNKRLEVEFRCHLVVKPL